MALLQMSTLLVILCPLTIADPSYKMAEFSGKVVIMKESFSFFAESATARYGLEEIKKSISPELEKKVGTPIKLELFKGAAIKIKNAAITLREWINYKVLNVPALMKIFNNTISAANNKKMTTVLFDENLRDSVESLSKIVDQHLALLNDREMSKKVSKVRNDGALVISHIDISPRIYTEFTPLITKLNTDINSLTTNFMSKSLSRTDFQEAVKAIYNDFNEFRNSYDRSQHILN